MEPEAYVKPTRPADPRPDPGTPKPADSPLSADGTASGPYSPDPAAPAPVGAAIEALADSSLGTALDAPTSREPEPTPHERPSAEPLCRFCGATERHPDDPGLCTGGHFIAGNEKAVTDGVYRQRPANVEPVPLDWRERYQRMLHSHVERIETALATQPAARLRSIKLFDRLLDTMRQAKGLAAELEPSAGTSGDRVYGDWPDAVLEREIQVKTVALFDAAMADALVADDRARGLLLACILGNPVRQAEVEARLLGLSVPAPIENDDDDDPEGDLIL